MTVSGKEAGATPAAATSSASIDLVRELWKELVAYGREMQLYPPGHPRLEARIESYTRTLCGMLGERGRPLTLQVRDGTLYSGDRPLAPDPAVASLAARLRERRIQLVRIEPGVSAGEARRLADAIVAEGRALPGSTREIALGPSTRIFQFPRDFMAGEKASAEDDIIAEARRHDVRERSPGAVETGPALERSGLSPVAIATIGSLLRSSGLRAEIEKAYGRFPRQERFDAFTARFFTVLKSDPRIDWKNARNVEAAARASLAVLESAQRLASVGEAFPIALLEREDDERELVPDYVKWQLLRQFIPVELLAPPRKAPTDVAAYAAERRSHEGAPLVLAERARGYWEPPDLPALRQEFAASFSPRRILEEYTALCADLAASSEEGEKESRRAFFRTLDARFAGSPPPSDVLLGLIRSCGALPRACRGRWRVQILRTHSRPQDVLDALCGEKASDQIAFLERPPLPLGLPRTVEGDPGSELQDVLRQLLYTGDDFALDVAYSILRGPRRGAAIQLGWVDVFAETAGRHGSVSGWIDKRAAELCFGGIPEVLAALPADQVRAGLKAWLGCATESDQLRFVGTFATCGVPRIAHVVSAALELRSPRVRRAALDALGRLDDPEALPALVRELERRDREGAEPSEVDRICEILALQSGERGRELLSMILCQRREGGKLGLRLLPQWSRTVRDAARRALAAARSRGS